MSSPVQALTGWPGTEDYFQFADLEFAATTGGLRAAVEVLRGERVGVIYRNMVPAEVRADILRRFSASEDRVLRGSEAPGEYIGTVHYLRPAHEYLDAAPDATAAVAKVIGGDEDPLMRFWHRARPARGHVPVLRPQASRLRDPGCR